MRKVRTASTSGGSPGLEYTAPFDLNQRDVAGQTALYAACKSASVKIVEALLNYRVRARKGEGGGHGSGRREGSRDDQGHVTVLRPPPPPPTTPKKTGIQSLLAKLRGQSLSLGEQEEPLGPDEQWVR